MRSEWALTYDYNQMAHVLSDGKRKAWFLVDKFLHDHIGYVPKPGFDGLATMIAMGLRPYKTEGDFTELTATKGMADAG